MPETVKSVFSTKLSEFVKTLNSRSEIADRQWTIKGFIDVYRRIYTISSDTKIITKLLEIHLFPRLMPFAAENGYALVPAGKQNYYPDISFISEFEEHQFALDFKTTYRYSENPITREHFYHVGAKEANRKPMLEALVTNFEPANTSTLKKNAEWDDHKADTLQLTFIHLEKQLTVTSENIVSRETE